MNASAQILSAKLDKIDLSDVVGGMKKAGGMNGLPSSNTGERIPTFEEGTGKTKAPNLAFIDYLTFTLPERKSLIRTNFTDSEDFCLHVVEYFLKPLGLTSSLELKGGRNGYKHHCKIQVINDKQRNDVGYFAFDGNNATTCISLSGIGCKALSAEDYRIIRQNIEDFEGKITRIDLAHDCLNGEVTLQDVHTWYDAGLFSCGSRGKYPSIKKFDDCGSDAGSTIYVGSRESGKMFRAYEKGKQLGDKSSNWVRLELELHSTKRAIPYEILEKISSYLSGSYDCMNYLSVEQSRIVTQQKTDSINYEHLEHYCKQAYGRFIDVMLQVYDGCPELVVEKLRRDDALPSRLAPSTIPLPKETDNEN